MRAADQKTCPGPWRIGRAGGKDQEIEDNSYQSLQRRKDPKHQGEELQKCKEQDQTLECHLNEVTGWKASRTGGLSLVGDWYLTNIPVKVTDPMYEYTYVSRISCLADQKNTARKNALSSMCRQEVKCKEQDQTLECHLNEVTGWKASRTGGLSLVGDWYLTNIPVKVTDPMYEYTYVSRISCVDTNKYSFFPRTIPQWNALPGPVVMAPTVESFRARLEACPP
ncbi:hypothetical protein Bbelb_006620 [Branchiostoma belcheri]|nr:hypothetical protein Bbelb_006620 [Branchiostoma belcheri]